MRSPKRHVAKNGTESWKVRFRLSGQNNSATFYDEQEAKDFCLALATFKGQPEKAIEWHRQRYDRDAPERPELPTLDEWAETYITGLTKPTDGTKHGYRRSHALSFGSMLGDKHLNEIGYDEVAHAVNHLARKGGKKGTGYSDKSMENHFGLLKPMLDRAVRDGLIAANPCDDIELPELTGHEAVEMYLLSHEEFEAVHAANRKHYRPLVMLLAGSGIRWGEAEALTIGDLLLNMQVVRITKAAKWDTSKAQRTIGPTKTRNSKRTVTLPASVCEALEPLTVGRKRSDRLFVAPRGGPLRHKTFWEDSWVPACEKAGLIDPRPRIHDLRHAHASWLIAQGVPLPVIQKRLGHHSITVTVDLYGHLTPDLMRQAADAAELVFNPRAASPSAIESGGHGPGEAD